MSEYPQYDPKILINAIEERQAEVSRILKDAKDELKAKDARFRLRGWNDKSVVHVANWIIEGKSQIGQAGFEPQLMERVYYDPEDPSRIDCFVGLGGLIGRIKEEEMKGEDGNKILLQELKKLLRQVLKNLISEDYNLVSENYSQPLNL